MGYTAILSRTLVLVMLLCPVTTGASDDATVRLSLGGPRKVEATIDERGQAFDVAIRMIGVTCFDTATNNRLSREKARAYALDALARHLGVTQSMTVKGVTVTEARTEGKVHFLKVNIPRDGITKAVTAQHEDTPRKRKSATPDVSTRHDLFTAKEDYIDTVKGLTCLLLADLPPLPTDAVHAEAFFTLAADLEESGLKSLSSLRQAIRSDKLLLTIEMKEVMAVIDEEEAAFIERLKQHVSDFQATVVEE